MDTKYLFLVIIIVAICRLAFVSANNAKLKKRYGPAAECHVQANLFALSHYHAGKRSGV